MREAIISEIAPLVLGREMVWTVFLLQQRLFHIRPSSHSLEMPASVGVIYELSGTLEGTFNFFKPSLEWHHEARKKS